MFGNNKNNIFYAATIFLFSMHFGFLHASILNKSLLKKIEAAKIAGGVIEIKLNFEGVVPEARSFAIEHPPRISIDLPNTRTKLPKYNKIGFPEAEKITILKSGKRTRIIISQDDFTSYSIKKDNNSLLIYIGGKTSPSSFKDSDNINTKGNKYKKNKFGKNKQGNSINSMGIREIDFQRGEDGEGNVIIRLNNPDTPMDVDVVSGKIRLQLQGEILPEALRHKLDVVDFGTPVQFIDSFIENGNTIILVEAKGKYEHLTYQTEDLLTISVKPFDPDLKLAQFRKATYTGDKISLNFQNIEVRSVLQLIADFTKLNLVASDAVTGSITLRLKEVPWDQALDIILKTKGLDKRLLGNVLIVAPAKEIAAREKLQLESEKQLMDLAPVYTDIIQISYADATNIAQVLSGGGEGSSLLTEQGSVQVVKRTNSLLVKDTQKKLDEIRTVVKMLDIPVKQVMIEARIVTLSSKYNKELGVKWSGSRKVGNDTDKGFIIGGGGTKASLDDNNIPSVNLGDSIISNLITNSSSAQLAVGFASNSSILNLELSALLSDGGGEVISQPKVITADKQEASIKAGKEVPYATQAEGGGTTIEFKEVTLSLTVTPQITPEGSIIMDIKVTNDDTSASTSTGVPILSKNEITTQVLVKDGETVVLGGVFKQSQSQNVSKVPLLGDIPVLGHLFKKQTTSNSKEELMVFITPKVLDQRIAVR